MVDPDMTDEQVVAAVHRMLSQRAGQCIVILHEKHDPDVYVGPFASEAEAREYINTSHGHKDITTEIVELAVPLWD
jgi:hypothetical protein